MPDASKNYVMVDEDTIEAAAFGMRGIESGRRVGWAKAFDAMRRADSAERDINMIRSDIRILSNFAARAFGALTELLSDQAVTMLFRGDQHELKSYFPDGPYYKGKDDARRVYAAEEPRIREMERRIAELRSEHHRLDDRAFAAAKRRAINLLANSFGFPNREIMFEFMATSPTHDCAERGCYLVSGGLSYHFSNRDLLIDAEPWWNPGG